MSHSNTGYTQADRGYTQADRSMNIGAVPERSERALESVERRFRSAIFDLEHVQTRLRTELNRLIGQGEAGVEKMAEVARMGGPPMGDMPSLFAQAERMEGVTKLLAQQVDRLGTI